MTVEAGRINAIPNLVDLARTRGFAIFPGVFTPAFMAEIERHLLDVYWCIAMLRHDPKIVAIAKQLCGPELCDTWEAVVHHNPARIYDQWHFDIPWDSQDGGVIPCWRFAFYFRDYKTHSGALAVAVGSHLGPVASHLAGNAVEPLRSSPGDLVVWNLRTRHCPNWQTDGLPAGSPRNAVIFDYAAPGADLERYRAWRAQNREDKA